MNNFCFAKMFPSLAAKAKISGFAPDDQPRNRRASPRERSDDFEIGIEILQHPLKMLLSRGPRRPGTRQPRAR